MPTATHAVACEPMADEDGSRAHTVRMEKSLWNALGPAAELNGYDRSKLIRQFVRWYLHVPGAQLPQRPTPTDPKD